MTLFDSDVLIWHLRGSEAAQDALIDLVEPALSAITLMEVLQGVRNKVEQRICRQVLVELDAQVLPITPPITEYAIHLLEVHTLKDGLGLGDALIAATAVTHDLPLLTANRKHFAPIRNLQLLFFEPQ